MIEKFADTFDLFPTLQKLFNLGDRPITRLVLTCDIAGLATLEITEYIGQNGISPELVTQTYNLVPVPTEGTPT